MPSGNTAFSWKSYIQDFSLKADFSYFPNNRNTVKFGGSSIYHTFKPGIIKPQSEESIIKDWILDEKYALENALYISNEQEISSRFSLTYGLRYSFFQNMGGRVQNYDAAGQQTHAVPATSL